MKLPIKEIEELAYEFRKENGLSATEPILLKSLIRKLNIDVLFRPLANNIYGMSLRSLSGYKFMLINNSTTKGRQHFTIAHELYHLFFEDILIPNICSNTTENIPSEINANLFASVLLMPKEAINYFLKEDNLLSIDKILYLEHYFSVSRQSILIRLKQLKLISVAMYEEYMNLPVKETAKKWGYDTSLYEKSNENLYIGSLWEKSKKLFDMGIISEGHYLEIINNLDNEENEDCP